MRNLLSLKRSFDAALIVMVATVGVGLVVAVAQLVQGTILLALVLVASIVWFASPVVALIVLLRHRRGRLLPDWLTGLGLVAALVGAVHLTLLGTIRTFTDRSALVWNVDWRYHLNHAQTIARHGDLSTALDYLGNDVQYHVGPAWIAGAFEYFTGWGITEISFIAIPLMTVVVTFGAGAFVATRLGARPPAAVVAAGVLLVVPALDFDWVQLLESPADLRTASAFKFSAAFMFNSQFAWSVGMASVALLATSRRPLMVGGSVGLAATAALKPQYFFGFIIVAAAVGIVLTVAEESRRADFARQFAVHLVVAGVGGSLLLLTVGAAENPLGDPTLRAFATGLNLTKFRSTTLAAFVVSTIAVLAYRRARRMPALQAAVLLGICAGAVIAVLSVVQVPIKPEALARANAIGFAWTDGRHQDNIGRSLDPVLLTCALLALAGLATLLLRWRRWGASVIALVAGIAVLAPLPLMRSAVISPTGRSGHEAVEDEGLQEVLTSVPTDGSVLVVNDLADPAQNYARSLRSPLLTGYGGHQFVVANLEYGNYDEGGAAERLESIQRFFGSNGWSPWHTRFVENLGVSHVLVDDRCPPNWESWPQELSVISSSGAWTLAEVDTGNAAAGELAAGANDTWRPLTPTYGQGTCLSGEAGGQGRALSRE